MMEYGAAGEAAIIFEPQNSRIPMIVLHDLYFEHNGLSTQIDFLIITHKVTFILECKNLYGNIAIIEKGEFVRTLQFGKHWRQESVYSPITQNERHRQLIHDMRCDANTNILMKKTFDHWWRD